MRNIIIIALILIAVVILLYTSIERYNINTTKLSTDGGYYNASGYYGAFAPIEPRIYLTVQKRGWTDPFNSESGFVIDIRPKKLFKNAAHIYINGSSVPITHVTHSSSGLISLKDLDYDENKLVSVQVKFDEDQDLYGVNFIRNQISPLYDVNDIASIPLVKITLEHQCK